MDKVLKLENLADALEKVGFSQARLAKELDVSREAVSKWLKGKSFPKPDKLLKLALLLELSFEALVERTPSASEPVIAFRKKGARKTTDLHIARAKDMGRMLTTLVPFLPYDEYVKPATLKHPTTDYTYLQKITEKLRVEIGVGDDEVVDFRHLIKKFNDLQAVIIPVLWGGKSNHENALHIHLPESMTTWVYLNIDVNAHDFKFWMAHELGHVHAPSLRVDEAEDFADSFAGALLFPEEATRDVHLELSKLGTNRKIINRILKFAEDYVISPITIYNQVNKFAELNDLKTFNLGRDIFAATTNFNKEFMSISESLFDGEKPTPRKYISMAKQEFKSPFFDSLKSYLIANKKSPGFIQTVLDIPFFDAKEIYLELS